MEDKRIELKDLKAGTVRCIIPFKDDEGKDRQIEVYNVTGDRRQQIVEELAKIEKKSKTMGVMALEDYYGDLVMEFTDIKLDKTSIVTLLESPRLEMLILLNELNDMIYELQYEQMMKLKGQNRALILNAMAAQSQKEIDVVMESIKKSNELLKKEDDKNDLQ